MQEEGIEQVLILPFTLELAHLSPEDFITRILVDTLGARAVLVGDNFRFGHKHAGDVALLTSLGRKLGFTVEIVPAVTCRGRIVSSTGIRDLIRSGRVALAARFLLHPYALEGPVVRGRGIGSKQTVPTLNLSTAAEVLPAAGVYITRTYALTSESLAWNSITNIGYRPTFGDSSELSIETFLLDPFQGEPPSHIRVEFFHRVRAERKFDTPEALRAQILKDVAAANRYFRRRKAWTGQCISC
jgi:riboflavin kinase/FMN adenylyltransferase